MPTSAPLWASCSSPIPRQACPRWAGTDSSAAWQLAALLVWHFAVQCVWYSLRPACLRACLACSACLPALQWGMEMLVEDGSMVVKARLAPQFMQECLGGWVGGWLAG